MARILESSLRLQAGPAHDAGERVPGLVRDWPSQATRYACVLGMLLIAALTFGSALIQDWNAAGIQLLYALVYAVLLGLRQYNGISVDAWLRWSGNSAVRIDKD